MSLRTIALASSAVLCAAAFTTPGLAQTRPRGQGPSQSQTTPRIARSPDAGSTEGVSAPAAHASSAAAETAVRQRAHRHARRTRKADESGARAKTERLNVGQVSHPGTVNGRKTGSDNPGTGGSAEMRTTPRTSGATGGRKRTPGINPNAAVNRVNYPGAKQPPYPSKPPGMVGHTGPNPNAKVDHENHPGTNEPPYPGKPMGGIYLGSGSNPNARTDHQNHPGTNQPPYPGKPPTGPNDGSPQI